MMRSFLAEIPIAILEAASIDGAGLVNTLLHLQLERAAVRPHPHRRGRADVAGVPDQLHHQPGLFLAKVCAAATIISLPVPIAGFAAQDKLVQGLSLGAVK